MDPRNTGNNGGNGISLTLPGNQALSSCWQSNHNDAYLVVVGADAEAVGGCRYSSSWCHFCDLLCVYCKEVEVGPKGMGVVGTLPWWMSRGILILSGARAW